MNKRRRRLAAFMAALLVLLLLTTFNPVRRPGSLDQSRRPLVGQPAPSVPGELADATAAETSSPAANPAPAATDTASRAAALAAVRPGEVILLFADAAAYVRFLETPVSPGLAVTGRIPELSAVRVRLGEPAALQLVLAQHPEDVADVDVNWTMTLPPALTAEERAQLNRLPIGDGLLPSLGIGGGTAGWGRGVSIALLDTGVAADAAFGRNRLRLLDAGWGTQAGDGHATAVAALAAGERTDAMGVAPMAGVISVRVTDPRGSSDVFTVAQGIVRAAAAGAAIIAVSPSSPEPAAVLTRALDYAADRGLAVVAASGGDDARWPAADARVIAVGAIDAVGQPVGDRGPAVPWAIGAPGFGLDSPDLRGQRLSLDGSPASAGIVAGALAAVMSAYPQTTPAQAWDLLRQTATSGSGPTGNPAIDFGYPVLALGWIDRHPDTAGPIRAAAVANRGARGPAGAAPGGRAVAAGGRRGGRVGNNPAASNVNGSGSTAPAPGSRSNQLATSPGGTRIIGR